MKLGLIDKDEYRQYRYWLAFQRLILLCASGITVAALLFAGADLRRLSAVVAAFLWLLFGCTLWVARSLSRHMVRELPSSLQSLLLFSSEGEGAGALEAPSNGEPAPAPISTAE